MKHILSLVLLTSVYLFVDSAWGADAVQPNCYTLTDAQMAKWFHGDIKECLKSDKSAGVGTCDIQQKVISDSLTKYNDACSNSAMTGGSGKSDCQKRVSQCFDALDSAEDSNPMNTITGLIPGMPPIASDVNKKCPTYSDQPKDLARDFKDTKKEFGDAQKALMDSQKTNQKSFAELQKEITELQDAHAKAQLDMKETLRKEEVDRANTLNQLNGDIRKLNSQLFEADIAHAKLQGQHAQDMSNLSLAIIQADCEVAIRKLANDLAIKTSSSGGSMIQNGAKKNQTLQQRYAQCLEQKNAVRTQMVNSYNSEEAAFQNSVGDIKKSLDERNKALTLFQTQAPAAAQDIQNRAAQVEAKYQSDLLRLSNQLQNLSKTAATEEMTQNQKVMEAQMEKNKASNALGMIDSSVGNSKETYLNADGAYRNYKAAQGTYKLTCCSKTDDTTMNGGDPNLCKQLKGDSGLRDSESKGTSQ